MKNIIYIKNITEIGGTESFIYYLVKKYRDYDITVYYKSAAPKQIERISKYALMKRYVGQKIKCEKAFFNYTTDIIDNVEAKEYIQIIHTDYKEQGLFFSPHPKIDRFMAVTKIACESFKAYTGLDCEVCYNPIVVDKPKKVLNLVSATRLTKEKGAGRMMELANRLEAAGIPFIWLVFTNYPTKITNSNIICVPTQMDIFKYIANADYLVQLSDKGEGFGYAPAEALTLGVPVITTPCPAFLEIGVKDRENAFVLDYDMEEIPVKEIYKGLPKFKYEPPKDKYKELLAKGKSDYEELKNTMVEVECIRRYNDVRLKGIKFVGDRYWVDGVRAEDLVDDGYAKYV